MGNQGICSDGEASYISLAIDSMGTPYVAYKDAENGYGTTVKKFKDDKWETVGKAGFSDGQAVYASMALDFDGVPYVAYGDLARGQRVTVKKFNGNAWEDVGNPGFSHHFYSNGNTGDYIGGARHISLVFNSNEELYVGYQDRGHSEKLTVKKFNGSAWEDVGTPGFSEGKVSDVTLTPNSKGTPYVAYIDLSNMSVLRVRQLNGYTWASVGHPNVSNGSANYSSLRINSEGILYVAYSSRFTGAALKRFDGKFWDYVGSYKFSEDGGHDSAYYVKLALDSKGTPYVAYQDDDNVRLEKISVMKYD